MQHNNIIRYFFGDLILDVQRGSLTRQGEEIPLPKLSYNLLLALVSASPTLLSQQELIDQVWGNIVIGDETLKQRIKLLRKVLGDKATDPTYIEAVRGRGYRLIPEVNHEKQVLKPSTIMVDLSANDHFPNLNAQQLSGVWQYTAKIVFITLMAVSILLAITIYLTNKTRQSNLPDSLKTTSIVKKTSLHSVENPLLNQHDIALNYYQKGLSYYKRYRAQDNKIAIDFFNKALSHAPTLSLAYAGLSQAYAQQAFQFSGGKSEQQKAIDNAYQAIVYDNHSSESYKALGTAYYVSGWLSKSIDPYLKSLTLSANNTDTISNLGFIYSEQGKLLEALKWDETALRLEPEHVVSMVHAGQTLARLGKIRLAQYWYNKAIDKQPDYLLATFHLAKLYTNQQKFLTAQQLLQSALNAYQNHPLLLEGLADNYYFQGQKALAQTLYQKIIKANNNVSHAAIMLYILSTKPNHQNWQALVEPLKLALKAGSDKANYSYYLALLYAKKNQHQLAIRYLVQSVEQGLTMQSKINFQPIFNKLKTRDSFLKIITNLQQKNHALASKADLSFWQLNL